MPDPSPGRTNRASQIRLSLMNSLFLGTRVQLAFCKLRGRRGFKGMEQTLRFILSSKTGALSVIL
jgi:hypothetical protein